MKLRNKNEGYFQLVDKVLTVGQKEEEQGKKSEIQSSGQILLVSDFNS